MKNSIDFDTSNLRLLHKFVVLYPLSYLDEAIYQSDLFYLMSMIFGYWWYVILFLSMSHEVQKINDKILRKVKDDLSILFE